MNETEQNAAIAEACGIRYHRPTEVEKAGGSYYQYEPDYLHDLNAMHEAESKVPRYAYYKELAKVVCGRLPVDVDDHAQIAHATAPQRAEAFLRTIGKWKE